jgi:hypothetical protein
MEEELKVEAKNKIFWDEPITLQLKDGFLDRYEPAPGIPTPEVPEPLPYFKLIEEVEDEQA